MDLLFFLRRISSEGWPRGKERSPLSFRAVVSKFHRP